MKIGYELFGPDGKSDPKALEQMRHALNALPVGVTHAVVGAGFKKAGAKTRRVARSMCPPGKGGLERLVSKKGRPRLPLRDSIFVRLVGWRWRGRKVPKSAVVVVAAQPHAHLIERGTKRWKKGPRPFLEPAMEQSNLLQEFKAGAQRHLGKVIKQIETKKLTRQTARQLRLKVTDTVI